MCDLQYCTTDGIMIPFGVLCFSPTLPSRLKSTCAIKLDNSLLYSALDGGWYFVLQSFLSTYQFEVHKILRCDLAADFIFLKNRVSGAQLCQRLRSCQWWKCGSVNVCEYFTMPYSVKWQDSVATSGIDANIYLQQGQVIARTESMTFGKMSSDAQVAIYDKTLELMAHTYKTEVDGKEVEICNKEYIRDAWKSADVYNQYRHTWRIEIRLKSNALFITDSTTARKRQLCLDDLDTAHLRHTFLLAQDRYFRIIDATDGGTKQITADYVTAIASHKSRLPVVTLFDLPFLNLTLSRVTPSVPCNQFNRNVINRLAEVSKNLKAKDGVSVTDKDKAIFHDGIRALDRISYNIETKHKQLSKCARSLASLCRSLTSEDICNLDADRETIIRLLDLLRRRVHTQSPVFIHNVCNNVRSMASMIYRQQCVATRYRTIPKVGIPEHELLSTAGAILAEMYKPCAKDDRITDVREVYANNLQPILYKVADGLQITEADYKFVKFCHTHDIIDFNSYDVFGSNRNLSMLCSSKDYGSYLVSMGQCDKNYANTY